MPSIARVSVSFHAPVERVWEWLTDPTLVKQYFYDTDLLADWKIGGMMYYRWVCEGKDYEDKGIITALDAPYHLAYDYRSSWDTSPDIRENYKRVTYTLTSHDGETLLVVTQESDTPTEAENIEKSWNNILSGLKKLIEP
jgi:uncharacterized protein YndB with AHSA1/START domain